MNMPKIERKSINILIVGESGIGKTTCINSIPQYLQNRTLDQALKKPLKVLIPTHFTYNTKNSNGEYEFREVKIGKSVNENFKSGESHTLKPQTYSFQYKKDCDIHIIDTPGISDHRGIIQDKKNMQEIVNHISQLTHLNLIVFLLPPDTPVLSPNFEFCFKELIMQFHRNAAENIVFGFTKSSSCGFEIGQTLVPLKLLLKEIKEKQGIDIRVTTSNSFAFDNVAFRYLCIKDQKHKVGYQKDEIQAFDKSFIKSRKELTRLLDDAIKVNPHDPKFTAMLNYTRNVILRLAGPMAMIATSVQKTLENIREREVDFEKYKNEESKWQEKLFRPIIIIRYHLKRERKTFCSNCGILKCYYGNDRLPFIEADPEVACQNPFKIWFANDAPIKDGKYYCLKCGPDFKAGISYKTFRGFKEEIKEEDQTVSSRLDGLKKSQDDVEKELEKLRELRDEMEKEREKIIKASAKFSAYLKKFSIVPYNDVTENYLNVLIDLEKCKTSEHCKSLQRMKKEYLEEKRIFDENLRKASKKNDEVITPENIKSLLEELVQLKHYGKDIRDAFIVAEDEENDQDIDNDLNQRDVRFSIIKPSKFIRKFFASILKLNNPF